MSAKKICPPAFRSLLGAMADQTGLPDREISKRADLDNSLISRLKRGQVPPTRKQCILLGWALNQDPTNLYADIKALLIAAASQSHGPQTSYEYIDDLVAAAKSERLITIQDIQKLGQAEIWVYVPARADFNLLHAELKDLQQRVTVLTGIENARVIWQTDIQNISVKTPNEYLLSRNSPLIIWKPHDEVNCQVFKWLSRHREVPPTLVPVPMEPSLHWFLEQLRCEARTVTFFELAGVEEQYRGNNSVVLIYADYFLEPFSDVESNKFREVVQENLRAGTRYLFINPYPPGGLDNRRVANEFEKARHVYSTPGKDKFQQLDIPDPALFRKETFLIYGHPSDQRGKFIASRAFRQSPGMPVRFEELDSKAVAELEMGLLDRLIKDRIENWLWPSEGAGIKIPRG
jgi:hypothetical protein